MRQPFLRSIQLGDPARHLEAERDRLGHYAMGAAGHQGSAMADGELGRGLAHRREVAGDDARRFDQLHRRRSVVQVLAGHPHVDVAGLRLADRFVEHGEKGDHVMTHARLDLGDLLGVESSFANFRQGGGRDAAKGCPGLAREDLDAEPQLESVLVRPDRPDRRRRVSLDQEKCRLPVVNGRRHDYTGGSLEQIWWAGSGWAQDAVGVCRGRGNPGPRLDNQALNGQTS
jgi:hypothetical protein